MARLTPGHTQMNILLTDENKQRLKALRDSYRDRINPGISMTGVIQLLIAKEFRKLKLEVIE